MHVHSLDYHDIKWTLNSTPGPSQPRIMHVSQKNTGKWTDREKSDHAVIKMLLTKSRLGCGLLLSPAIKLLVIGRGKKTFTLQLG